MLKIRFPVGFLFLYFLLTICASQFLGKGRWLVVNVEKCPKVDGYLFEIDITRRKVNRTHDGFSGWLLVDEDLDETFALKADICKKVDGGCKPYQTLADESFCHFMEKYAKDNVEKWYRMAGLDMPICPMPAGKHQVDNYVFDYGELPAEGPYGKYGVQAYLQRYGQNVACVHLDVLFEGHDENDSCGDDEY